MNYVMDKYKYIYIETDNNDYIQNYFKKPLQRAF